MRKKRKDAQINTCVCTIGEIEAALRHYGLTPDRHLVRRCISWIQACALDAAAGALEDIHRGRIGLTEHDEDLLDPLRVRLERIEADREISEGAKKVAAARERDRP